MFGQLVAGPPGSGKSTYCEAMQQLLHTCHRDVAVVNLDPANDRLPYKCAVDVCELISVADVMEELDLGPNGALLHCMEYIDAHASWLKERLAALGDRYVLFDMPGQVELFIHHGALPKLIARLTGWGVKLVAVHLVDSHYCSGGPKFLSALLLSLIVMTHLELPHINVLSKLDILEKDNAIGLSLESITDVLGIDYLLERLDDELQSDSEDDSGADVTNDQGAGGRKDIAPPPVRAHVGAAVAGAAAADSVDNGVPCTNTNGAAAAGVVGGGGSGRGDEDGDGIKPTSLTTSSRRACKPREKKTSWAHKYRKLNRAVAELVTDSALVSFHPLTVKSTELMAQLLLLADRANGFEFSGRPFARVELPASESGRGARQGVSVLASANARAGAAGGSKPEAKGYHRQQQAQDSEESVVSVELDYSAEGMMNSEYSRSLAFEDEFMSFREARPLVARHAADPELDASRAREPRSASESKRPIEPQPEAHRGAAKSATRARDSPHTDSVTSSSQLESQQAFSESVPVAATRTASNGTVQRCSEPAPAGK